MESQEKNRIALISPSSKAYSETFIKAQKELLPFDVTFYSDGKIPTLVDGSPIASYQSRISRYEYRVKKVFGLTKFNFQEEALLKSFRLRKIDAVLAQYGPTGEVVWKICKSLKIPLIVHFHGFDASVIEVLKKNNNYKNTFKNAKKVFAVSKRMEKKLIEIGCPKEIISHHPCGPNDNFLEIEPNFSSHNFIGIGRFTDKKAPYYSILAFYDVLLKFPHARLTIGGDGPLRNACINLVKHLQIEHAVNLPGVMSPKDFEQHLKTSRAFVQHSVVAENGDSEGTPVAVLEASAAGIPVISTKHAGIPDVIIDGETGLLVDEHDAKGMSRAMLHVLKYGDFAKKMGKAGKKRVRENFTMKHYIDNLSGVIESALQK